MFLSRIGLVVLCLQTENRARKTHVFDKRNFGAYVGVGWVGGAC